MGNVIEASELRRVYEDTLALRDVSISVRAGEVVAVVGPNGSGKTTLLNLLAGADLADGGKATVLGLDRWRDNFEIRRQSVYIPAETLTEEFYTPRRLLSFWGSVYGVEPDEWRSGVVRLAAELDILGKLDSPWPNLSLGEAKKVMLVAGYLPPVALRIFDEPFAAGVDPVGMEVLYRWMDEGRRQGESVVFSTQVLEQAETIADRVAMLSGGALIRYAPPRELIESAGIDPDSPRAFTRAFMELSRGREGRR